MKARHIILLTVMAAELILFFYCLIKKSNHVPAGYICAILSLALMIFTGWLLLFPKVTPIETTGDYQIKRTDCFYTDTSRLETYVDDGSYRELPVSFWYPMEYKENQKCPLVVFSHGSFGMKDSNETLWCRMYERCKTGLGLWKKQIQGAKTATVYQTSTQIPFPCLWIGL